MSGPLSRMRPAVSRAWLLAFCSSGLLASCELGSGAQFSSSAAASEASWAPATCAPPSSASEPRDPLLPEQLASFCRYPGAPLRRFGGADGEELARACERVLGPPCAREAGRGLVRVLTTRYLHRAAPERNVAAIVSEFDDSDVAYAHFSEALLGDADPGELELTPLGPPFVAVIEARRLLAWRGRHVLRLAHLDAAEVGDPREPEEGDLRELGRALLAGIAEGEGLPAAVSRLPEQNRIELGIRFDTGDALGVPGLGPSAWGHYRDGSKRWRVLAIRRPDADSAKDVLGTLSRHPAARKIKGLTGVYEFVERRLPSEPRVDWVVGQRGEVVYGVGDEATALPEFMRAEAEAKVKLTLHEKLVKLSRIHLE